MDTNTATPKLNEALAKAQAEMRAASKSATNPHFKSRYADLAEVMEVWTEVGPKFGLAIMHEVQDSPSGTMRVRSCLLHSSGEERHSTMTVPVAQATPQGYGSALTYLRRYNTQALTGMVSDEDDDGNAASRPAPRPVTLPAPLPQVKPAPQPSPPKAHRMPIHDTDAADLRSAIESAPTVAALTSLVSRLRAASPAERDALRPVYEARLKVVPS